MSKKKAVKSPPTLFENKILRIDDVCEMLQFKKSTIYELVKKDKIPFRKKGKTLFFMSQEIFDWVDQGVA